MKSLILIFLVIFITNSQAEERDSKTFDCPIPTPKPSKIIILEPSKMNWQEHWSSLAEFEAALDDFVETRDIYEYLPCSQAVSWSEINNCVHISGH